MGELLVVQFKRNALTIKVDFPHYILFYIFGFLFFKLADTRSSHRVNAATKWLSPTDKIARASVYARKQHAW